MGKVPKDLTEEERRVYLRGITKLLNSPGGGTWPPKDPVLRESNDRAWQAGQARLEQEEKEALQNPGPKDAFSFLWKEHWGFTVGFKPKGVKELELYKIDQDDGGSFVFIQDTDGSLILHKKDRVKVDWTDDELFALTNEEEDDEPISVFRTEKAFSQWKKTKK